MVLNSVMVNYELYRRNYDFERLSLITELLLLLLLLRQLPIASVALLVLRSLNLSQLLWRRRDRCVRYYIQGRFYYQLLRLQIYYSA